MKESSLTRREFMEKSLALAGAAAMVPAAQSSETGTGLRTAVDRVTLGRSGLKPTRLGMGTGVRSGSDQIALGKSGFNDLVHAAYDRGIRYFDCAQQYKTFPWMAEALDGLPRDELFILSKIWGVPENPAQVIDEHLRNFKTDYIDCMLLHCTTRPDWPEQRRSVIEALQEAKAAHKIGAIGVSCHSLDALRVASREDCIDVNLVRINPQGKITDREKGAPRDKPGAIEPVVAEIRQMKARGNGVIGMKIIGEGNFRDPADRERSIRFAMAQKEIDAVTIGFVKPAEMDEAIQRMNRALAEG